MTTALVRGSSQSSLAEMTSLQKAAIVMLVVGEETAAQIMSTLMPAEVHKLGEAMCSVEAISYDVVNAVLDEFLQSVGAESGLTIGRGAYVREVLGHALGDQKAQSVYSRIVPADSERPIDILDWMEPETIAEFVETEHPQIGALAIASLEYARAANVLMMLPPDTQTDIVRRIANLEKVPPAALKELRDIMQTKFSTTNSLQSTQVGGVKAAARIINFTEQATEDRILKRIRKDDKGLSQDLEDNLFVFEYMIKSEDRAIQTVLREIDATTLTLALKGTTSNLHDKLLRCVSQRAAANIADEMAAMGPVRLSAVLAAQKEIISVARRLADEGKINLAGRGGEKMV